MATTTFSPGFPTPDLPSMAPSIIPEFDFQSVIWIVVLAFVISFFLAMAMGANDVANSFGTSVGSGVITLRQCWILATIFEVLGATLIGARVSETIRKGILDVSKYNGTEDVLMVGNIAGLAGSAIWQFIATYAKLPVSGTHSIIGGILGFTLVQHQLEGVKWTKVGLIVGSWFLSPVLAGFVGTLCFMFVKHFILVRPDPLEAGLFFLPLFYGLTCFCNVISIALSGPPLLGFDMVPLWGKFVLALGLSSVVTLLVLLVLVPFQRKEILQRLRDKKAASMHAQFNSQSNSLDGDFTKSIPSVTIGGSGKDSLDISLISDGVPGLTEKKVGLSRTDTSDSSRPLLSVGESATGSEVSTRNPTPIASGAVTPQGVPIGSEFTMSLDPGLVRRKLFNKVLAPSKEPKKASSKNNVYQHQSLSIPIGENPPADPSVQADKKEVSPNVSLNAKSVEGDAAIDISATEAIDISPTKEDVEAGFGTKNEDHNDNVSGPTVRADGPVTTKDDYLDESLTDLRKDNPAIAELFRYLQILTACFGGFTHGGNDVSNAVGPLIAIWMIFNEGSLISKANPPMWLLLYGGVGISLGLIAFGKRVIGTMGHDLSPITPSSGFTIEVSSALTVLIASNMGIPISTTHCKVGAIVFVGRYRARESVSWSLVKKILLAWFVTVPVSGLISAAIFAALREAL